MMQEFRCNGLWWLPDKPSERIAGSLQFSDQGAAELSLFGVLGEPPELLAEKRVPVIQGLVWDLRLGEAVTLTDCWAKGLRFGSVGVAREQYHVGRLFIGSHLYREQEFLFSALRLSLSGLPSWADNYTGISHSQVPAIAEQRGGFELRWI